MPRSVHKLPKTLVGPFILYLQKRGFEVDTAQVDFRRLMFKSSTELQWTQGFDGKTKSGRRDRSFLRFTGPEESIVSEFINQHNQQHRS